MIPVSAAIVGMPLYLTSKWTGRSARISAAFILFVFVSLFAAAPGMHMCDEGRTPLFVMLAGGLLSAAMPFVFNNRRWHMAVSAWVICMTAGLAAAYLTDIYHQNEYTGNPANSSGRYWHTPFTSLYPRNPKLQER